MKCNICPRQCNIDREKTKGFCGAPSSIVVAKSMLHHFEEPLISGKNGSGAVFFSGCNLRCVYCQNAVISQNIKGEKVDTDKLVSIFNSLQESGAHNINLITATHFLEQIIPALEKFKKTSNLPIIYNCGGYESKEMLQRAQGLIDVYLPDFKYFDNSLASKLSKVNDYYERAVESITEMVNQQPKVVVSDDLIKKGVIIRHLVLPGYKDNSMGVLRTIAQLFPSALVSIMSQYTPSFYKGEDKNLKRKVTKFEYNKVLSLAQELGIQGFCQDLNSATSSYTPDF